MLFSRAPGVGLIGWLCLSPSSGWTLHIAGKLWLMRWTLLLLDLTIVTCRNGRVTVAVRRLLSSMLRRFPPVRNLSIVPTANACRYKVFGSRTFTSTTHRHAPKSEAKKAEARSRSILKKKNDGAMSIADAVSVLKVRWLVVISSCWILTSAYGRLAGRGDQHTQSCL